MLRPHACVSEHEGRFTIGLQTEERQGKRSLSDGDADGGKNPGLAQYLTFLPVSDVGSRYGRKPGAL